MKFSDAVKGYMIEKQAAGYSPNTLRLYQNLFSHIGKFLQDPEIEAITLQDLQRFMIYLQNDHEPQRFNKSNAPLSRAHIDNYWKSIRSLFRFCNETLGLSRPDLKLKRPEKTEPTVFPFKESEWKALVKACEYSKEVNPKNRRSFRMRRPTANRDKALLYLMIDTGLRIGEIVRLKIEDVNLETGECHVFPVYSGRKSLPRTVYIGKACRREMWLYMTKRSDLRWDDKLFDLTVDGIRSLLRRLGEAAGVENVHPHRFRHTFAIQYLRNGGDIFTLKALLGHKNLKMVERYLQIAQVDLEEAHRRASPGDRWKT